MATHSSVLAWRIPWTEEPGGLQLWGHEESDMTERRTAAGDRLQDDSLVYTSDASMLVALPLHGSFCRGSPWGSSWSRPSLLRVATSYVTLPRSRKC